MVKFTNITNGQLVSLIKVEGIDEFSVTNEAMEEIRNILKLEGCNEEELTSIRNGVVKTFSDIIDEYIEEGKSYKEYKKMRTTMSAITATIDYELFKMGALF